MVERARSSRPANDTKIRSDSVPSPDPPLSTQASVDTTNAEKVPTIGGTIIEDSGAQSEGPHNDLV